MKGRWSQGNLKTPKNRSQYIGDGLLMEWEEFWVTHQPYLLERGYRLSERYSPNWVPSWRKIPFWRRESPMLYPDSICTSPRSKLLDAIRISDGNKVALKVVESDCDIPILEYLHSQPLSDDKRNHTVPILDIIPIPGDDEHVWIVMPILLRFDTFVHPFRYVSEMAEAICQLLEGLEFMHEHGVAHRDACFLNFMVDSSKLVPDGDISFFRHHRSADWSRRIVATERRSVAPLKYYFIDFETAIRYRTDEADPLCLGIFGQERDAPEFSRTVPYNPFKLDIYQSGMILALLIEKYDGVEFLMPLRDAMTVVDPDERPTATEASTLFGNMVSSFTEEDMCQKICFSERPRSPLRLSKPKIKKLQMPKFRFFRSNLLF